MELLSHCGVRWGVLLTLMVFQPAFGPRGGLSHVSRLSIIPSRIRAFTTQMSNLPTSIARPRFCPWRIAGISMARLRRSLSLICLGLSKFPFLKHFCEGLHVFHLMCQQVFHLLETGICIMVKAPYISTCSVAIISPLHLNLFEIFSLQCSLNCLTKRSWSGS